MSVEKRKLDTFSLLCCCRVGECSVFQRGESSFAYQKVKNTQWTLVGTHTLSWRFVIYWMVVKTWSYIWVIWKTLIGHHSNDNCDVWHFCIFSNSHEKTKANHVSLFSQFSVAVILKHGFLLKTLIFLNSAQSWF